METRAEDVLREAMHMSAADRAFVARQLVSSLDPELDEDVEIAWQEETARRLREMESGAVSAIRWEDIRERMRKNRRAAR